MSTVTKKKLAEEAAMILAGLAVAMLPPPEGLGAPAMTFLGLFLWVILNWAVPVMPSYIAGLLMLLASVLFGLVPFKTAFSAFSGSTAWLIIGVLALGSAVSKTGLLTRLSFAIMNVFPPSFRGQAAGLIGAGLLIGPFMPSTTAKVSIVGGIGTRIAELLGFAPRSRGMNGIFCAMYTGFSLIAATFMTCSFYSYLILGMISPDDAAPFTFAFWTLAMVPWGVFVMLAAYGALLLLYRPKEERTISREEIRSMAAELGPMKREEKITLAILVTCILCWALERVIGVPSVIPAVGGLCALFLFHIFEPKEINTRVNWSMIIFLAAIIGLAPLVKAVGLNEWIQAGMSGFMAGVGQNPYVFVTAVAALVLLSRFLFVSGTTAISIMVVILVPFCEAAGMNAWVGGIIAYVMAQPFFFKYQNPNLLIGYEAAGGDDKLSFRSLIPYSFVYHAIALAGLWLSVPWWQYLGIIH